MSDGLLPIGMFSRASSLSIKSLRAYHEAGILVPAQVDSRTGYRNYTVDQLADAAIISRLRALDVPLDQVREVLHRARPGPDASGPRRAPAHDGGAAGGDRAHRRRAAVGLGAGHPHARARPTRSARDTVRIVGVVTEAEFADWLAWAFDRLAAILSEVGATPTGPAGGLYAAELADDGIEEVEAFVPIAAPLVIPPRERDVSIGEVPAARVAVLVHVGDYDSIADTYRTLGAWVARNAEHAGERVREWYVVGPTDGDDPKSFRTEIAWPIKGE